jgi:hypothetical protein
MSKPKKELKGMLFILLGLFFSILGMISLSIWTEHAMISVILSFLGLLIIVYGLFRILKANSKNGKV